ncbi:MAG: MurT ligase domain-containing protein [Actinomycetaceae bacterium]|nr:MurT ligase domain-containing protein [Actinomycetaceae bacterium]
MIGGRVAMALDPRLLAKVSEGKKVVIVTGTNGKSTTTAMVREALMNAGVVASNVRGDNMTDGVLAAMLDTPDAQYAVLEVDELYVPKIAKLVKPAAFVLLNLSRDQLDRVGEMGSVESRLRQAVNENPDAFVVANCDDPLITSAAWDSPNPIWVAAGTTWTADSVSFPRTGTPVIRTESGWQVAGEQKYSRPKPHWVLDGNELLHEGNRYPLALALPGRANRANAAQAVAAAHALGVKIEDAISQVNRVSEVSGRYARENLEGRLTRILLAKNPAGWQEALSMLTTQTDEDRVHEGGEVETPSSIILSVNGQVGDGEDLSWLWDVEFDAIRRHDGPVIVCGERGTDMAVRLRYDGIECDLVDTTAEAVRKAPIGSVDLLANYTAFRDFKAIIPREFGEAK